MAASRGNYPPPDDYRAPDWLRYARAIMFEGYAPPVYPAVGNVDARRLVEVSRELGGDTLRFQPVGYRATYPSKVFPTFPDLGSRDLIDEVSRECRRVGLHLYCYCILAGGLDAEVIEDPRYAPFVLRDVDGNPPRITTGYGNGHMVTMCGTGDSYRRMVREQARELCEHDIDGICYDAPSGYRGVCFCDSCRQGFRQATGMDPQRLRNVRDLPFSLLILQDESHRTITLGIAMMRGEYGLRVPIQGAAVILATAVPLIMLLAFQRYVTLGVTARAIKG